MAIIVHSPFSGAPVKVREQDLGRAVRDESGKIFYVLEKADGEGYYGSATRRGSEKDEQKSAEAAARFRAEHGEVEAHDAAASTAAASTDSDAASRAVHDATGKRRPASSGRLLVILFILAMLAVVALYLFTVGPLGSQSWQQPPAPPSGNAGTQQPADGDAATRDPFNE